MPSHEVVLSRLRKCKRWVEKERVNGYIKLNGVTQRGDWKNEEIDEDILKELLELGKVECDKSQRILSLRPSLSRPGYDEQCEVQQVYWRVL